MKTTLKKFTIAIMMIMGVFSVSAQSTILIIEIQPFLASIQGLDAELVISSEITTTENYFFVEEKLVLEDWMVDQSSVEVQHGWNFLRVDIEPPLKVEDWMICKEPWCKQKLTEGNNSFTF